MIKKNKKAQFYILTAIILISLLFGIAKTTTKITKKNTENMNIQLMYEVESKNIINNAIYESKNETIELEAFTKTFIKHYDNKNIEVKILYLYKDDNQITISNRLGQKITINPLDIELNNTQIITITKINLTIGFESGNEYQYDFDNSPKEFKSLILKEE